MFHLTALVTFLSTLSLVLSAAIPPETHVRATPQGSVRKDVSGWVPWRIKPKVFILSLVWSSKA